MMEIGVREFRGRLSEVLNGDRHVTVTNNGRVVGEYLPATIVRPTADRERWLSDRVAFREHWKQVTPDWEDRLAREGLDEEGEPFGVPTFR